MGTYARQCAAELNNAERYAMHAVADHLIHGREHEATALLAQHPPERAALIRRAAWALLSDD